MHDGIEQIHRLNLNSRADLKHGFEDCPFCQGPRTLYIEWQRLGGVYSYNCSRCRQKFELILCKDCRFFIKPEKAPEESFMVILERKIPCQKGIVTFVYAGACGEFKKS